MKTNIAWFTDGEGPIARKDLAFDTMGRINFNDRAGTDGRDFFAMLSLYDDLLAERPDTHDYQAGDTLALAVPHYLAHGITNRDIEEESRTAILVPGIEPFFEHLRARGCPTRIISTAYRPMWNLIGAELKVPPQDIACTELDIDQLREQFMNPIFLDTVHTAEQELLDMLPLVAKATAEIENGLPVCQVLADGTIYEPMIHRLDQLYWQDLPSLGFRPLEVVTVVGGRRKVEWAHHFAAELGVPLDKVGYGGDSITDSSLFQDLAAHGGLPVAFNGNEYALRDALVGVATTDARSLIPLLEVWEAGGREAVEVFVRGSQMENGISNPEQREGVGINARYGLPQEDDWNGTVAIHKEYRQRMRGAAAALG